MFTGTFSFSLLHWDEGTSGSVLTVSIVDGPTLHTSNGFIGLSIRLCFDDS